MLEDVGGDFDEEAVERALVPSGENFAHFGSLEAEEPLYEGVGLADHLHVAILDAIVDHLDVVARASFADVGSAGHAAFNGLSGFGTHEGLAGFSINFRSDGGPDRFEFIPRGFIAAGHEGRAETRAFLAAGNTGADEAKPFFLESFFAADGVGPEGVSAVDHDIVGGKQGQEAVDYSVGGFAGLNENNNLAGECDRLDEFLEGLRADDTAGGAGIFGDELVGFFDSAVVN